MLYQMQKTRGLYLHTRSRVFKNREGSITLFHLSIQKLKVPSISIVQCPLRRFRNYCPPRYSATVAFDALIERRLARLSGQKDLAGRGGAVFVPLLSPSPPNSLLANFATFL